MIRTTWTSAAVLAALLAGLLATPATTIAQASDPNAEALAARCAAQAERLEGAARSIEVQGRALGPEDFALIHLYERGAAVMDRAKVVFTAFAAAEIPIHEIAGPDREIVEQAQRILKGEHLEDVLGPEPVPKAATLPAPPSGADSKGGDSQAGD